MLYFRVTKSVRFKSDETMPIQDVPESPLCIVSTAIVRQLGLKAENIFQSIFFTFLPKSDYRLKHDLYFVKFVSRIAFYVS